MRQSLTFAALLALAGACTEYGLDENNEVPDEPEDTGETGVDSVPDDTSEPDDTSVPDDTQPDDTGPVAQLPVYAHSSSELFSIDPTTGAASLIGTFEGIGTDFDGMVDLAIDISGHLYGSSWSGLWRVDPLTAEATWVCATDVSLRGLAFASDGRLFGADSGVYRVNPSTCALTPLGGTSTAYSNSGDLVGLPDGMLYWTVTGGDNDQLVRLDPDNGNATVVGTLSASSVWGVAYHDASLYGFDSDGGVHRVNPTTGTSVQIATAAGSWWGATTNPVVWP